MNLHVQARVSILSDSSSIRASDRRAGPLRLPGAERHTLDLVCQPRDIVDSLTVQLSYHIAVVIETVRPESVAKGDLMMSALQTRRSSRRAWIDLLHQHAVIHRQVKRLRKVGEKRQALESESRALDITGTESGRSRLSLPS